jgi:putative PIN family toxin of toxin-antitoxin system
LYSRELLNELEDVIQRPRHRVCISRLLYEERIEVLRNNGMDVNVYSVIDVCRDPKDNYLLALAKDGEADYLVTDDKDLLVLQQFGKTKIVDLTVFEKERLNQ